MADRSAARRRRSRRAGCRAGRRVRARRPHGLGETREVAIIQSAASWCTSNTRPATRPTCGWCRGRWRSRSRRRWSASPPSRARSNIDKPMGNPHWDASDKRAQIPWRTWLQMTDGHALPGDRSEDHRGQRRIAQAVRSGPAGRRELLRRAAADPRAGHALELQLVRHRAHRRRADAHDRAESRIAARRVAQR